MARGLSLVAGGAVSARPVRLTLCSCEGRSPGARQRSEGFAGLDPCLRRETGPPATRSIRPFPNCSPPTRAMAAGPGSCWRSSTPTSRCCGFRTGWRSWRAGESIRRDCRRSHDLIHVEARDARDALWAMEEGLRCSCLSAVIGELWGDPRALDFTATRRLAVASERSGVAAFLIRLGGHANLSGARMRWRIASAPSLAQRSRSARAGAAGVGCRAVPRARTLRRVAGASRMKRIAFHLVAAPGDRTLGEERRLRA